MLSLALRDLAMIAVGSAIGPLLRRPVRIAGRALRAALDAGVVPGDPPPRVEPIGPAPIATPAAVRAGIRRDPGEGTDRGANIIGTPEAEARLPIVPGPPPEGHLDVTRLNSPLPVFADPATGRAYRYPDLWRGPGRAIQEEDA